MGLIAPANGFAQLACHVLVHISLPPPGNAYDAAYCAWAARAIGDDTLRGDATLLARVAAREADATRIWWLPLLLPSFEALRAVRARPLAEVDGDARAIGALRGMTTSLAEHAYALIGLGLERYEAAGIDLDDMVAPVEAAIAEACAIVPELARDRIELVHALGPRGRGFERHILVGAPASWNDVTPHESAAIALHEHVVTATELPWVDAERAAIARLSLLEGPIGDAYRRWLARLDLSSLQNR